MCVAAEEQHLYTKQKVQKVRGIHGVVAPSQRNYTQNSAKFNKIQQNSRKLDKIQ